MQSAKVSLKRAAQFTGLSLLMLLLLGLAAWGTLALFYFDHMKAPVRIGLASAFAAISLAALAGVIRPASRWRALAGFLALFAVLLTSWLAIKPSNDRDWRPEVAVLPYATFDGDRVTVHNIRNFDYRSETEFTRRYYDKTFDLRQLDSVAIVASYWMGPSIAHVFLTFGFAGANHVAISIEARKEKDEEFSLLRGSFRQYELYYVVADERDVIRVRTNYRRDPPEDVFLYEIKGTRNEGQKLFLYYMESINALKAQPQFYNELTTNCTTSLWMQAHLEPVRAPFSWKVVASGYLPELLYERGRLDNSIPFAELQRRSHINARAQAAGTAADFSRRVREASATKP